MISIKTPQEIAYMQEGGRRLKLVMEEVMGRIQVGMSTNEIDKLATILLRQQGVGLSFTKVDGYKYATCICINEQIVHTEPSTRKIKNGDVVTIDIGAYYKGFHTDYATSCIVGTKKDKEIVDFLRVGKSTLQKAIQQAKWGNRFGDISEVIGTEISNAGYFVIKQLTGHGVGRELHEDPFIPGYLNQPKQKTARIEEGMVFAIEVIYSMGTDEMVGEPDSDWSIITPDRSISACFEHTVAILNKNTVILT